MAPAYDLLATQLLLPSDEEELALTLNGKKRRLTRADFALAMGRAGMNQKVIGNLFDRIARSMADWEALIEASWIANDRKREEIVW